MPSALPPSFWLVPGRIRYAPTSAGLLKEGACVHEEHELRCRSESGGMGEGFGKQIKARLQI